MDIGLLILRVVVGGLFIGHGAQKLFGWFGGHGRQGTGGWFESIGYRPGVAMATLAGAAEFGGGVALLLGLFTWAGAAAIIGVMTNAILSVHIDKGPWVTNGGWEFALTMAAVAAMLAYVGPGTISLDNAFGITVSGWLYGSAMLAIGVISGLLLNAWRTRNLEEMQAEAPTEILDSEERPAA